MSLATRTTVERALAAYLTALSYGDQSLASFTGNFKGEPEEDDAHPLAVHCICGEVGEDGALPAEWDALQLPALVITAVSSEPHVIGYDICNVALTCLTTPDEIEAPTHIQDRIGWLSAVFDEDRLLGIRAALNAPDSGPDNRTVKGLQVIGIERAGESHSENGRHIIGALSLRVHAIGQPDPE